MTLIIPIGEDARSCASDDANSGCLARSPDDATDQLSDVSVTPELKRHSLKMVFHTSNGEKRDEEIENSSAIDFLANEAEVRKADYNQEDETKSENEEMELKRSEMMLSLNCDNQTTIHTSLVTPHKSRIVTDSTNKVFSNDEKKIKGVDCLLKSVCCQQNANPLLETGHIEGCPSPLVHNVNKVQNTNKESENQTILGQRLMDANSKISELNSVDCNEIAVESTLNIALETDEKKPNINDISDVSSVSDASKNSVCFTESEGNLDKISDIKKNCEQNTRETLRTTLIRKKDYIKIRKHFQRRSVSESNSYETDQEKKTSVRLRHSFSSYENCDKPLSRLDISIREKNILDNNEFFMESGDALIDSNIITSNDERIGYVEERLFCNSNTSLEKVARKSSIEITDTLVNNVKKSMIEEYKNLKKKNSSLSYDPSFASFNSNKNNVSDRYTILYRHNNASEEGYHRNDIEAFENVESSRTETKDQTRLLQRASCHTTPSLEIQVKGVSKDDCSVSDLVVSSHNASDLQTSTVAFPSKDVLNASQWHSEDNKTDDVSSPPSRLEIWKNILAEKRNSIRNHIKGFNKSLDGSSLKYNNTRALSEEEICYIKTNENIDNIQILSNNERNSKVVVRSTSKNVFHSVNNICNQREEYIPPVKNNLIENDSREVLVFAKTNFPPEILEGSVIRSVKDSSCVRNDNVNLESIRTDNNNSSSCAKSCHSFVCINSLHILPYKNESMTGPETKTKSSLQIACQGIAEALHTFPSATETSDTLNNNGVISSKLSYHSPLNSKEAGTQMFGTQHSPQIASSIIDKLCWEPCNDNADKISNCGDSHINSSISIILSPVNSNSTNNEKSQQCPTPPEYGSGDEGLLSNSKEKCWLTRSIEPVTSEDDSDYCQTDDCGDECDYCSGEDAGDEDDDTCEMCNRSRNLSPVCKHNRVITNGSLKPPRNHKLYDDSVNSRMSSSRSLVIQAALRRRHINHQELSAIREYSITSDELQDSDEEQSHDDSMCDISSSWRYGLYRESLPSDDSTLKSERSVVSLPSETIKQATKKKCNSLPAPPARIVTNSEVPKRPGSAIIKHSSEDEGCAFGFISGVHLPPRPPRVPKVISAGVPFGNSSMLSSCSPRPTMGVQVLHQRPSSCRLTQNSCNVTGPKTVAPRSPINPNPPFGFPSPPSPPAPCPGSPSLQGRKNPLEGAPPSPRTNSRSGALVTRNFSISDDEGGQRLSRRHVTITRHESAYKEAADRGYFLPPTSPVDPYWLTWKLGVLQKTVEEVGSHLEESEKVVETWGSLPQDSNLADQHVHNVRKFREILPDLQRGIDDVNDQAARFSVHNVPLTPANSAALHDLNNRWKNLETTVNDRWRQVAGRSREVTPLTPAQLASSVCPPWERATATNKVPYYINHAQETTHWDHPEMMELLDSLSEFNHIKFSAYRTATKLRNLQKKLSLDRAKLQLVTDVFDEHGLRGQNDRLIDVNDMVVVLSTLYGRISSDHADVNTTLATDLCLNWLLNVYDSQRTGQMRVLSFRVGLICLCRGHLEEKYRYMFRLIADPNRLVDQRKLGLLLHDCVQVPRQMGEVAAFGGSNIEPSVRSCFTKAGKDRETIEAVHFLTWVQQEPQSLVWLAVLHRVAASENVQHQVKCNICKTCPIVGLRYRCLKCLSFDMCQRCFFDGRSGKSHKITHPMHEYCTATTAGDEMKDFTKALKNKFKSKRSLQKHTKKGYLPVQTVLEGDPLESPSPSPSHNVSSQDMHSRLELYASRLAEVELRTNSNSTPDSEDEHGLIAQYCQSLSSSDAPFPVPKSPLQIMASVDADQKDELEQMIRDLEEENRALQAEYERLKSQQPTGSAADDGFLGQRSEAEMLAEAKLLREHKGRLEARMSILEDHNRQLEAQLQRLRQLLVEQQSGMGSPNKSGTLQTKSVTASQLAMDSPAKINGHPTQGDLEKAVGSLVASMNRETENDSHSDHSKENDYDNTGIIQVKND